jgi:hypothetical protein
MNKNHKEFLANIIGYIRCNEEQDFFTWIKENPCHVKYGFEDHVFYKAMRLAEEVLKEPHFIAPGDAVRVDAPEGDDMWNNEFRGTVKFVKNPWKLYTIEDKDGVCFDVELRKLETC